MTPLPPLSIPWTMKSLGSAKTSVDELPDGRVRFGIVHEVLHGVTPEMLVWWLNNMDGTVDVGGQQLPRYRAWHPVDHVALTYVRPGRDGRKFSAGAQVRIQEFFGARAEFGEAAFAVEHHVRAGPALTATIERARMAADAGSAGPDAAKPGFTRRRRGRLRPG